MINTVFEYWLLILWFDLIEYVRANIMSSKIDVKLWLIVDQINKFDNKMFYYTNKILSGKNPIKCIVGQKTIKHTNIMYILLGFSMFANSITMADCLFREFNRECKIYSIFYSMCMIQALICTVILTLRNKRLMYYLAILNNFLFMFIIGLDVPIMILMYGVCEPKKQTKPDEMRCPTSDINAIGGLFFRILAIYMVNIQNIYTDMCLDREMFDAEQIEKKVTRMYIDKYPCVTICELKSSNCSMCNLSICLGERKYIVMECGHGLCAFCKNMIMNEKEIKCKICDEMIYWMDMPYK